MKLRDIVEVIRRIDTQISVPEICMNMNSYYKDICNYAEPLVGYASIVTDGTTTLYKATDFLVAEDTPVKADNFMKFRRVSLTDQVIKRGNEATIGDNVWQQLTIDTLACGYLDQEGPKAFPAGYEINIEFYAYPDAITVETDEMPLPLLNHLILWRLKADIFSEQRQWDRTGYFNRRYERGLLEFRKMIRSSGTLNVNHTNTGI